MNLSSIADLLEGRIGLDVASLGTTTFQTAVVEHMQALAVTETGAYASCLANKSAEFEWLLNRLLVPETWFFRGGELFHFLTREIANRLQAFPGDRVFRILSLPCATGEEPYSLAISLLESGVPASRWHIDGVDLGRNFVDAAKRGIFREFSFRQTPDQLRAQYFSRTGNDWVIDPSVRAAVHFQVGNIVDSPLLQGSNGLYDLILCRNLLIYLTPEARLLAVGNLLKLLVPDGLLGVGHAEPQILMGRGYQRFGPDACFLFQREAEGRSSKHSLSGFVPVARGSSSNIPTGRSNPKIEVSTVKPLAAVAPPPMAVPAETPRSLLDARRMADLGQLEAALNICQSYLGQFTLSADAFSLLGVIQQARGKPVEANEAFRKALYLNPNHQEALTHSLLLSSNRGDESRTAGLRERLERVGKGEGQ